jgi:hypothetical protein
MGSVPIFLSLFFAAAAALAQAEERVLELAVGETLRYSVLDAPAPSALSARDTAMRLLRHLADGDIEQAALLSNAPRRRYEVLHEYRGSVGEEEFKRLFAQYFLPENRLVAEVALDAHRLLVWDLGGAEHRLAGQYYVEVEGRFLMDDVPSEKRAQLRRVLEAYRMGKARF